MKKSQRNIISIISLSLFSLLFIISACGDGSDGSSRGTVGTSITSFNFLLADNPGLTGDVIGTVAATTITLTVPYGTDVTNLIPTIVHTGQSVSPAAGAAQDFTDPVLYTVTAADFTEKDYTVTVNEGTKTPIAHWMFDEGGGITAYDSSGNGNDGTLSGIETPQWITGLVGDYALGFSGSSDYVSVNHHEDFNSQDFTVTAWLANYNLDGTTSAYFTRINGWRLLTADLQWQIKLDGGDTVGSGYYFPVSTRQEPEWHHYAITVSSPANGSEVVFYVDGVQVGPIHTYALGFSDSADGLYIGRFNPAPPFNWNGAMDDIRFYNEALTAQEIVDLYNLYTIP